MKTRHSAFTRRQFLKASGGALAGLSLPGLIGATDEGLHRKKIPSSGEAIPAIGMGTWITFNVGSDPDLRQNRLEILKTFFDRGGRVIDSSPMYGTSEAVVGYCLDQLSAPSPEFSATKVWTRGEGAPQIAESKELWGVDRFDLLQVHNLVNWREHLALLKRRKEEGQLRYIGVTTSHGRRHDELEQIMRTEPLDFVQLTYNVVDREAEQRLLPLAAERGMAVIANRPFQQKNLFHRYQHHPLPEWADEVGCTNWAEFFLKFIISHPSITCAIPATSQLVHMRENMGALTGPLPDQPARERMARYVQELD